MPETRIVDVGEVRLNVVIDGPEAGRPVLLLHGFPDYSGGWRHLMPALAEAGYRVYAPDQRGYNTSDKPGSVLSYRQARLVRDVIGLLDAMGVVRAHVIGHDWGGAVAWAFAQAHPERLDRLAVINCPRAAVLSRALLTNLRQLRRSWYIFLFQLPLLPEWWLGREGASQAIRALRGSSRRGSFPDEVLEDHRTALLQPGALRAMVNWYRASLFDLFVRPEHSEIAAPTLLVWGTGDIALGEELAEPSLAICRDARLEKIEGASHWPHLDERERVRALLMEHLAGQYSHSTAVS